MILLSSTLSFRERWTVFNFVLTLAVALGEPRCTPILGVSGVGKSEVIKEVLRTFGKPRKPGEMPVVVVESPSYPTIKAFASEILLSLNDPLYHMGTEVLMVNRIKKLFYEKKTQLLIIEEMQNLIDQELDKLLFKTTDFLKRLINITKKPIVIMGLPQTIMLLQCNRQLKRRFTECYTIKPFDIVTAESRGYLASFLKTLQNKFQFQEGLQIYTKEMTTRFYYASGGVVGYIIDILYEALRLALKSNSGLISRSHLAQAYNIIVCGNNLIGINPFVAELSKCSAALDILKDTKYGKKY